MAFQVAVATVICAGGDPCETISTVDSVQAATYLNNVIVVVDSGAGTRVMKQLEGELDPTVVLLAAQTGPAIGESVRLGVRHAIAAYNPAFCWILQSGVQVSSTALEALVRVAERLPRVGVIGSRLLRPPVSDPVVAYDGAQLDPATGLSTLAGVGLRLDQCTRSKVFDTGHTSLTSTLLRRGLLELLGQTWCCGSDTAVAVELADRARAAGLRVVMAPKSHVYLPADRPASAGAGEGLHP